MGLTLSLGTMELRSRYWEEENRKQRRRRWLNTGLNGDDGFSPVPLGVWDGFKNRSTESDRNLTSKCQTLSRVDRLWCFINSLFGLQDHETFSVFSMRMRMLKHQISSFWMISLTLSCQTKHFSRLPTLKWGYFGFSLYILKHNKLKDEATVKHGGCVGYLRRPESFTTSSGMSSDSLWAILSASSRSLLSCSRTACRAASSSRSASSCSSISI